jgi:hypothetical protein
VTRLRLDGQQNVCGCRQGREIYRFFKNADSVLSSLLLNGYGGALSSVIRRPGRETDH